MNDENVKELLLQSLETEAGGIQVYEAALECAVNEDLRQEWEEYLDQTREHEQTMLRVVDAFGISPTEITPGRTIVKQHGESLVAAIRAAKDAGDAAAAQLVAAECVLLAETKDHQNWELLSMVAEKLKGEQRKVLTEACEQVEDEEDEHYYHTAGWTRELWIEALGMRAVLPPPEEEKHVKTAIGAARAKHAREEML
jgi:rubrerythrin